MNELVLRPRGFGRFVSAAFLGFWLCGWAIGESLVLWLLVVGAIALLTGTPPGPGREPLELGPALAIGAFLLVWLSLWTLGGYLAIRELLRLLWSSDRIVADPSGLRVHRRIGPFRSTDEIPRETIRRIYFVPGDKSLRAETEHGPVVLSTLGSPVEREQAAATLRETLRVPEEQDAGAAPSLPEGWQEIVTPEGETALVRDLAMRRKQAAVALGLTLAFAALALVLFVRAGRDVKLYPLAAMACAAALGLAWGTAHLARTRIEWRIRSGALTRRRRSGADVRDLAEASRLELTRTSDSDGDDWFALEAVAVDKRSTIERSLRDPAVPRRLGIWLAKRARLPFDDRATNEAMSRDRERALAQLRESGALGRLVAGWVERKTAKPPG